MLKVNTAKGIFFVNKEEIIYIKAGNKHSIIYLVNPKILEIKHLLKWYEIKEGGDVKFIFLAVTTDF